MIDAILSTIENEEQRNDLAVFYSKYKKRFYAIAFSKLHNEEDAEDAVQEAFSRIAEHPEKFFNVPPNGRAAYTDVIVRHIAVDFFNTKSRVSMELLIEDEIEDTNVSLENDFLAKISRDEILKFVDSLPTLQRNVLMLNCVFGFTMDETSQRLNISLDVASKRLMLARKAIKAFIEEREKEL